MAMAMMIKLPRCVEIWYSWVPAAAADGSIQKTTENSDVPALSHDGDEEEEDSKEDGDDYDDDNDDHDNIVTACCYIGGGLPFYSTTRTSGVYPYKALWPMRGTGG